MSKHINVCSKKELKEAIAVHNLKELHALVHGEALTICSGQLRYQKLLVAADDSLCFDDTLLRVNLGISLNRVSFGKGRLEMESCTACEELKGTRVPGTTEHFVDECILFSHERDMLVSAMRKVFPEDSNLVVSKRLASLFIQLEALGSKLNKIAAA